MVASNIEMTVNIFDSAIVRNSKDCSECKGSGLVWTWNDAYEGFVPSYCECGVQIGTMPLEDEYNDDDDREAIQPGDYQ